MRRASILMGMVAVLGACGDSDPLQRLPIELRVEPERLDLGPMPLGFVIEGALTLINDSQREVEGTVAAVDEAGLILEPATRSWSLGPGSDIRIRFGAIAGRVGEATASVELRPREGGAAPTVGQVRGRGVPRAFDVEPEVLDFGVVRTQAEAERTVRIINRQSVPLLVDLAPPGGPFRLTGPTTRQLSPGGTETVTVVYRPLEAGDARARFDVVGRCEQGCSAQVAVRGEGAGSGLRCPARLDFGTMNPGSCVRSTLSCPSLLSEPLEVVDWRVDSVAGTFRATDPSPTPVPAGGAFALPLRFCPTALGPDTAELVLSVREPGRGTSEKGVGLEGMGGGPDLRTQPITLRFGGAKVGDAIERTLVVENAGYAPLNIDSVSTDGPFELVSASPDRLEPAEGRTLRLRFVPPIIATLQGVLRFVSDDPDTPEWTVPLSGEGVPDQPCRAVLEPDATTFGLVNRGEVSVRTLTLRATGPQSCAWFEPRIEGSAGFVLQPGTPRSGVVTSSRAASFDLAFAPTVASPMGNDQARFVVDVPNVAGGQLRADLEGVASTNALLRFPSRLDFGPLGVDATRVRTVRLYNLGTTAQRINQVTLMPGTSPDFTLTSARTAVRLQPGEHLEAAVQYAPRAPGRDGGRVAFIVAGAAAPLEVPLFGEADDRACGHITGAVCTPDGLHPSVGAEVVWSLAGRTFSTLTDEDGTFDLFCLPRGEGTLSFRRGHFRTAVTVAVERSQTTQVPVTCLDPTSPDVAVVTGAHDRVQTILEEVGIPYTLYDGTAGTPAVLTDRDLLLSHEIVMLNCGFDDRAARRADIADNLRAFIAAGGSVYASDFAYDAVEATYPDLLEFAGSDAIQDAAENGSLTLIEGQVVDPVLLRWMPPIVTYDVNLVTGYTVVDGYGPSTTVYARGDLGGTPKPLVVSTTRPGRLVYTTYHYTAGLVDPVALIPLRFAIFEL